jgi:Protein of unknown function (DUF4230)
MNSRRSGGALRSLILTTGVVIAVLAIGLPMAWNWIGSSFKTETVDRSAPPVLMAMRNEAKFEAAYGEFEEVIDVEKDVSWLPPFLAGERTSFLAVGKVSSYVNFNELNDENIELSEDGKSVVITLPKPRLEPPVLDLQQSGVLDRDRGLLDRIGGVFEDNPTGEKEFYLLAEEKLADAAAATELLDKAEENTTQMLEDLMAGIGVANVTVKFDDSVLPDTQPAA